MMIKKFQERLRKKKLDFAIFLNVDSMNYDTDLVYFAGYKGIGALVIPKKKPAFLLVPDMEYGRVLGKGIRAYKLKKKKKLFEEVVDKLNKNRIRKKKIGINKNVVTLNVHKAMKKYIKKARYYDVSLDCAKTRAVKNKEEIEKIKKACNITDKLFSLLVKNLRSKKLRTELDIVKFLDKRAKSFNCSLSFSPVVASGKGASVAHYEASKVRLRKGFMVLDFGVKYKDYNSDMTRTIYIGKPTTKEKELYYLLLGIQEECIRQVKAGHTGGKVFDAVHCALGEYSQYFNHGLGHGIGVRVHELPNLTIDSKDKIEKNMIFTIEPGIYELNKYGIRIEDTVLMKKTPERLTKSTKDLLIIDF